MCDGPSRLYRRVLPSANSEGFAEGKYRLSLITNRPPVEKHSTFMPYENIHLAPAGIPAQAINGECQCPHYLSQHNVAGNCFFQVLFALAITINSLLDTLFAQM